MCSYDNGYHIFRITWVHPRFLVWFLLLDLLFYVYTLCNVDRCLPFCTFSFGHCVVCFSSIYGCWLPLWYLQTLFHENLYTRCAKIKYIWQMKCLRRRFHNDISFIWIVLNISIYPRVIDDSTLFDPCLQPEV
jgi:hypothetical protein